MVKLKKPTKKLKVRRVKFRKSVIHLKKKKSNKAGKPRKIKPVKSRKFLNKKTKRNIKPAKYKSKAKAKLKIKKKIKIKNLKIKKRIAKPTIKQVKKIKKSYKNQVKNKNPKKFVKKEKKIIKENILHKAPKDAEENKDVRSKEEALFKAKIRVVGIGGGGGSIVSEIGKSLEKASFVIADTDIRALKKRSGLKYFWFGENLTRGLGTGANPELAKKAAEEAKERMGSILKDQDILIFIASLGGGLGSGATEIFAEAAREFGGITFGIFTLPFKFEGKNKYRIAQNALKLLKPILNVSLIIPNEKIFKIIDANTPITDAFSLVNKSLTGSLESLINLIYNPGVINIDFADLRTILKGKGNSAFLNTVEESGKDRADKICARVLLNPLLQGNKFDAEKILFNISGSDNLSMFEVEKISKYISDSNPTAKIIFGISKSHKLKSKIKTTILMTGNSIKGKFSADESEIGKTERMVLSSVAVEKNESLRSESKNISIEKKEVKKKPDKKNINKKSGSKKKFGKDKEEPHTGGKEEKHEETLIPVFGNVPSFSNLSAVNEKKLNVVEASSASYKKAIRRSGLDVKKVQEQEEKKRMAQEKEWEIPAFLRRVKFNK